MPYIVAGGRPQRGIGHAWSHDHCDAAMNPEPQTAGTVPPPRDHSGPYRIVLVCLGNICRSPTAEVLLREELSKAGLDGKVQVESAGTGDWHLGEPMHRGARVELARRGLDGSTHRARQIGRSWLADYDLLLAMDRHNLASLQRMAAGDPELAGRIQLMLSFDPESDQGAEVFDLLEPAARGVAAQLAAIL